MYELKTNTAVRIAVGPLVDPGDGKTAETGLTVTNIAAEMFQIKTDGNAVVRTAITLTASGGNNDMVHVTDDTTGMYDMELTAAQLNFLGIARIVFYDVDGMLIHWIDIQVVSANYFDHKYGTTPVATDGYHGAIWIDTTNGAAGTTAYTHGTADNPVDTLADALTLATALGINQFRLLPGTSITFTGAQQKRSFIGYGATITGGNQTLTGSYFEGVTLTGTCTGAIRARNCILTALENCTGSFEECLLTGGVAPAAGATTFAHCVGDSNASIDFWIGNCTVSVSDYQGKLSIATMTAGDTLLFDSPASEFILLATCTGGEVSRRGFHNIVDNSDGTTVYNLTATADIVDAAWNEAIAGHVGAGSTGAALAGAGSSEDITAIKAKTDLIPASPAAVGSAMTLADDAITAAKFDESTAFPLKSADTGATAVARTGADSDTLETLSDQMDSVSPSADVTAIKEQTDKLTFTDSFLQTDTRAWTGTTLQTPTSGKWNTP